MLIIKKALSIWSKGQRNFKNNKFHRCSNTFLTVHAEASPFDGIIKVQKILLTDSEQKNGLDSTEIDNISADLVNERNPVCYGNDNRWANHLYPIYLTERFLKSQYLSDTFFLNIF